MCNVVRYAPSQAARRALYLEGFAALSATENAGFTAKLGRRSFSLGEEVDIQIHLSGKALDADKVIPARILALIMKPWHALNDADAKSWNLYSGESLQSLVSKLIGLPLANAGVTLIRYEELSP